jgi:hypothetical protein
MSDRPIALSYQLSATGSLFLQKENVESHECHADGDGGIRNIERRPMIRGKMNVEKIDHFPESKTIQEISYGPA